MLDGGASYASLDSSPRPRASNTRTDSNAGCGWSGAATTAATSAQNLHGGQETTLMGLHTTFMHWGAINVAPGYTSPVLFESGGNPYGYSAVAGQFDDKGKAAVAHQAKRLVEVTGKLNG